MKGKEGSGPRVLINLQKTAQGFCINEDNSVLRIKKDGVMNMSDRPQPTESVTSLHASPPRETLAEELADPAGRVAASFDLASFVAVPTSAVWFDPDTVNKIEIDSLPEFFNDHPLKNSQTYKRLRNALIDLFYETPGRYLPVALALSRLAGDCCALMRVHAFLEHWGLINFAFDPKTQDMSGMSAIGSGSGVAFEPKIKLLETKEFPQSRSGGKKDLFKAISSNKCDSCGFELTSNYWLNDQLGEDTQLNLCQICWNQQRFPALFVPSDFRPANISERRKQDDMLAWSEEQQLEFVKAFKEINFDARRLSELEERFGSSAQMIIKFLQYPLQHFRNVLRLSNNSIENLFKRKDKIGHFDNTADEALFESFTMLRLLFDYVQEENTARDNNIPGSVQEVLFSFVESHREEIASVKERLLNQSESAAKIAEQQMLEDIQSVNRLQIQKLETKLRYLEEHEKVLLQGEQVLMIQQNEALINSYLN